ncbi:ABC transporter transmembrane domain-containing protein [Nonomuraea thailandensis]
MRAGDRLVIGAVRRSGPWTAVLAVTAVAGAAAELAVPYLIGRTVDALVTRQPAGTHWLALCAGAVAAVMLCESLGVWARGASGARAAATLRSGVLRHVLGAGSAATRRFPEGELVTRAGLNAEEVGRAPETVTSALALLVPTAGALVALTLIAPVLTLTLGAGIVVILLVLRAFLRTTTTIAGGYQQVQGEIAARLVEALGGARTIAAAGTADRESRRVLGPLPGLRAHGMALWRANASAAVRSGLVVPLLEVAVLAVGGFMLAAGDLTVGELYAAARYAVLGASLSTALGHISGLARARSAAGRVAEVLDLPPVRYGERTLPPGPGTVEFRDVAANGLTVGDLTLPGGSVTAVVGRSGAGKSLLAALAGRLAEPERGAVLLDGVPLAELSEEELRRAIGYAFERPVLTGETIGEAISPEPAPVREGRPSTAGSRGRIGWRRPPRPRARTCSSGGCRSGTPPRSATPPCPAASGSASAWPGRSRRGAAAGARRRHLKPRHRDRAPGRPGPHHRPARPHPPHRRPPARHRRPRRPGRLARRRHGPRRRAAPRAVAGPGLPGGLPGSRGSPGDPGRRAVNPIARALRREPRQLVRLGLWSVVEAAPAFLIGHAVARAIEDGFAPAEPLIGLGWLAALGITWLAGAVAARQVVLAVAAVAEPFRDDLLTRVVEGALRTGSGATAPPWPGPGSRSSWPGTPSRPWSPPCAGSCSRWSASCWGC